MRNKRRTTTRKRAMYGGQYGDQYGGQLLAPAPPPLARFPGSNFNPQDIYNALNNYLTAAYSINEAAKAIEDTSYFQNSANGTRTLQKTSALSFSTAASSFVNSLRSAYGSLSRGQPITIGTATAFAPYPAPVRAPIA